MRILVTGGAGFIGSAVCLELIGRGEAVLNIDKLSYASNLRSLMAIEHNPRYAFAAPRITVMTSPSTTARRVNSFIFMSGGTKGRKRGSVIWEEEKRRY